MHYLFIISSLLIWSSYSFVLRTVNISPIFFTFITASIGWCFLSFFLFLKKYSLKVVKRDFYLLICITFFFLVNSITFFYAYKLTSISNAIFSHYLAPVFVSLLAPLIIGEKIERFTIIALIISIAGMILIFYSNGSLFALTRKDIAGIFFGTISAICYAFLVVIVKEMMVRINFFIVMFYQGLFTFLIFLFILPFSYTSLVMETKTLAIMFIVGFTHSFLAPIIYLEGLKQVKAQIAGVLGYFEVLGSLLIGIIFFGEFPMTNTLIGGFLIIIAGGIAIFYENNRFNQQKS